MLTSPPMPTVTDSLGSRLQQLTEGQSIKLSATDLSSSDLQRWYRAARKVNVKIQIRRLLDGVWVYRRE